MVEGARLESEYTAKPYRGFESLPLRHLAEGKREGLHAGVEELDGEGALADRAFLPNQLVQALLLHDAAAVGGYIDAGIGTRRFAIQQYS